MSTLSFSIASPSGARKNRFSALVQSAVQAAGAEWRARIAARHVEGLSDETLHDIGIGRGEIDRAVRFGRSGL